jgi:hypothetical protein
MSGRRGGPRRPYRKLGPGDIPKHTCVKQFCRNRIEPKGPLKERVTEFYWCKTCHKDMGSRTFTRKRMI